MKKELIIKIVVSIVLVIGLIILVGWLLKDKQSTTDGIVTIQVVDKDKQMVINDQITFKTGDKTIDLLNNKYQIRSSNDYGSTFIYDIDTVKTDGYEYFFTIYVNDEMSMLGIDQIQLEDGMVITFKVTQYDPNYEE